MKNEKDIDSIYIEMARMIYYMSVLHGKRKHTDKRIRQNGRRIMTATGVK